ncbi:MAG: histidine triad nucleotide-binding protein [Clostridia bacterium]|nr:histidine triad nucleotide-binding protein [Clostridia bacterium]MBO7288477.1 histidine triad nucleotide-binding protein [Clostridia bacterium]
MSDCLFCKIVAGEIPSDKVYEDDKVLAFNDIDPQAPVHFLVIPKEHIKSSAQITADNSHIVAHIFEVIAKIAADKGISENGFRVVTNCGKDGGQTVGHLHFHVLAGRNIGWPPG